MAKDKSSVPHEIVAIKVKQWLDEWNKMKFKPEEHRRRPDPYFYMFTLTASYLKALTGIYRRERRTGLHPSKDTGIQRRHERERSEEIRNLHDMVSLGQR
ncbi:hypothetical protein ES703_11749 [subsurface metagenome]|nr:hypothetical protein [bacterium]